MTRIRFAPQSLRPRLPGVLLGRALERIGDRLPRVHDQVGPVVALNEGFQSALLVASGIVVVAVALTALIARGSLPAPSESRSEATRSQATA